MKSRHFLLAIFFLIFTAAVIVRLFALQVLGNSFYRNLAENQHELAKILYPQRGQIFVSESAGRDPVPVVTNVERALVYAVPPEIFDKAKTAAALSAVVGMSAREILEKISDDSRKWVAIKKQLPESEALAVKKLALSGIYLQGETHRFYPEKIFASQVLGFLGYVSDKRVGRYGVEEYFEEELAGQSGSLFAEKAAGGGWISGAFRKLQPAQDGLDLTLTLDRAIQFKAESLLAAGVARHGADSGSITVLDPQTGAILAMASYPTFDPNTFNEVADAGVFKNRAVSDAYEPGSVFKAITLAGALQEGAITPDETYEDTGQVSFKDFTIKNSDGKAHGQRTMTQVLEESLNTGAIYAQDKLGAEKFLATIKRFGFGEKTGITLPAESPGDLRNLKRTGDIQYATASFGQGITVTPLQLARAFAAIANGGKMIKPYIVEGQGVAEAEAVITDRTAATLGAMLVSVVENGHGKRAAVPGYYVAGKTGTAQVAAAGRAGYEPNVTIGSFAGFAPVDNPVFAAVVRIDNPKDVKFAESTAAPIFGELAQFILNYYQVPPTR
ncbi:MAG: penicillin-binding protein 2 [Candidatus Doudnabacteria bacterium]|nr:penicillin-binding protein 2 [Candidatus Doudnabacteria bacterium]